MDVELDLRFRKAPTRASIPKMRTPRGRLSSSGVTGDVRRKKATAPMPEADYEEIMSPKRSPVASPTPVNNQQSQSGNNNALKGQFPSQPSMHSATVYIYALT